MQLFQVFLKTVAVSQDTETQIAPDGCVSVYVNG